jgi:hypothetical protein
MSDEQKANFFPFIKISAICILLFYGVDIVVSAFWGFHYLRPLFDKATVFSKISADILFCAGALFILRRKERGLMLMGLGAVLQMISVIVSKIYILVINNSQGVLPNMPFFVLTFVQSLIWPIAFLGIMNWEELRKQFVQNDQS